MLRLINIIFLQWFFIRLTCFQQNEIIGAELDSISVLSDGSHSYAVRYAGVKVKYSYFVHGWIAPLTGFKKSKDWKEIGKPWLKLITTLD